MLTMTMRIRSPSPEKPADIDRIRSLVISSVLPEDRVEHVHVHASADGYVDVVLFISAADLVIAQVSGTALSSRLLTEHLPGWRLHKVWLEHTL